MNSHYSIIIPFYKIPDEWFFTCIKSIELVIKKMTTAFFSIIVINDCSPSPLPNFQIDVKNSEIIIITHLKNLGLSAARNSGLDAIRNSNSIVIFLDADDILLDIPFLPKVCSLGFFGFENFSTITYTQGINNISPPKEQIKLSSIYFHEFLIKNSQPVSSVQIRKSLLNKIRFDTTLNSCEDWFFWLEVLYQQKKDKKSLFKSSIKVTAIRKSPQSMSASYLRIFENRVLFFKKLQSRNILSNNIEKEMVAIQIKLSQVIATKVTSWQVFNNVFLLIYKISFKSIFKKNLNKKPIVALLALALISAMSPRLGVFLVKRRYNFRNNIFQKKN